MELEAVVLTGGASRRMGRDKAQLPVEGIPQAKRIVTALTEAAIPVTVLGHSPIAGAAFIKDEEEYAGPLSALARFQPSAQLVFVASCDLPLFDANVVTFLAHRLGEAQASVPNIDGWRQPLCAIYRSSAFNRLPGLLAQGKQSLMAWLDLMTVQEVSEADLATEGLHLAIRSANTPYEHEALLKRSVTDG